MIPGSPLNFHLTEMEKTVCDDCLCFVERGNSIQFSICLSSIRYNTVIYIKYHFRVAGDLSKLIQAFLGRSPYLMT